VRNTLLPDIFYLIRNLPLCQNLRLFLLEVVHLALVVPSFLERELLLLEQALVTQQGHFQEPLQVYHVQQLVPYPYRGFLELAHEEYPLPREEDLLLSLKQCFLLEVTQVPELAFLLFQPLSMSLVSTYEILHILPE
jgi:hypothetical protein